MRVDSLAFRLFVTAAVWTLLVLPVAGVIIYRLHHNDVQASFDGQLRKLVTGITIDAMAPGPNDPILPPNRYEPLFEETHSGWYWQIIPIDKPDAKRLVSASLATASLPSPLKLNIQPDANGFRWHDSIGPAGEPLRIVEVIDSMGHDPEQPRYSITVAGPLDWLDDIVRTFQTRLSIALTLAGLGLVAVTLFQVRFGLLPLQRIEQGLAAIRSGDATSLEGDLPAEIEPLQSELNALIKSNQDIVERARTQVGNLAHALKTPLAVITNEAREEESPLGAKVAEQTQIMRDNINHYLDRARMAARVGVIGRLTPVEPVVASLARALERINIEKGIVIAATCAPDIRFQGEKQDLEEMLGNLLDNACKWGRHQVRLTVEAPSEPRDARSRPRLMTISIEDDGPGLSADQRARIGKRGLRLDETKPGSGLGLSIVIELAQSYRGSCELFQSQLGGLGVHLRLPAA